MPMDSRFRSLPPLKRLVLMQQQEELQQQIQQQTTHEETPIGCSPLPAKKRKESRDSTFLPDPPVPVCASAYSLPTKKRVWALQPDFSSNIDVSPFDLNVEYKLSIEEEIEAVDSKTRNKIQLVPDFGNGSIVTIGEEKENDIGVVVSDCNNQSIENVQDEKEEEKDEPNDDIPVKVDSANQSIETAQGENDGDKVADFEDDDDGIVCAVCDSTDGNPTDPIVMCDGCDLMVHATCYGNPLVKGIPEGDWFCEQCLVSPSSQSKKEKVFSCCLCPVKQGAMKSTRDKRWAHIVCALLVPEVFFSDPEGREGIDCSKVPKKRSLERCCICKSTNGCAIVCSEPKCPLAFHVTCGLKENLSIEYKEGKSATIVAGFCKTHTELWKKQQQSGKYKIVAREEH